MTKLLTAVTLIMLIFCVGLYAEEKAAQTQPQTAPAMSDQQKTSYSIGLNIGLNLHEQEVQVDVASLTKGIQDGLVNATPALPEAEIRAALITLQKEVAEKQEAKKKVLAEKNSKDGDALLTANKTKEGVVALPSGLQYKVITEGKGPKPTATDTVVTHYKGTFIDGKQFDSSYDRGEPATFTVNGVIAGWTEALQLMPVGSKWQLWVPSKLAYGENGFQNVIPPNAALLFEIELISIQPKKAEEEPKKN
ncbi:FKBP-type peptidyl-prolyl cis-trans isomerase [bacterium]|nr:FKBP-type peptidyl-prolyl cis-trans isomerase [bacterium]MCI0605477.1 FKBP-type peptidyl-prolyl cis-trans isomerase [bacterium]